MIWHTAAMRQNIRVHLEPGLSPSAWVRAILHEAKSGSVGKIQKHLVGAKLQVRYPDRGIPNHREHAGKLQTAGSADFELGSVSFYVTTALGKDVIEKCKASADANRHPVLLVPEDQVLKATAIAEYEGIKDGVTIFALEGFVAQNALGISGENRRDLHATFQEIIAEYNRRIAEAETDVALKIELL